MTLTRPFAWFSRRHNLVAEAAVVVGLYALYELSRGLVANDPPVAEHHARMVVSLERSLHIFVEGHVQNAADALPGLVGALSLLPTPPAAPPRRSWSTSAPATIG